MLCRPHTVSGALTILFPGLESAGLLSPGRHRGVIELILRWNGVPVAGHDLFRSAYATNVFPNLAGRRSVCSRRKRDGGSEGSNGSGWAIADGSYRLLRNTNSTLAAACRLAAIVPSCWSS